MSFDETIITFTDLNRRLLEIEDLNYLKTASKKLIHKTGEFGDKIADGVAKFYDDKIVKTWRRKNYSTGKREEISNGLRQVL